jgi:hypothetical protein
MSRKEKGAQLSRRALLKNKFLHMSGECSICGDLLLTPPRSIRAHDAQSADTVLQRMIDNHMAQKHADRVRHVSAAVTSSISACAPTTILSNIASRLRAR